MDEEFNIAAFIIDYVNECVNTQAMVKAFYLAAICAAAVWLVVRVFKKAIE